MITFDRTPDTYRHWNVTFDGRVATLALDVDEDAPLVPGYRLKLNSYDLGVDIELNDALQRIRFEHPSVSCVVITSAKERLFCAGANIPMLGASSHAWKVNFCKFTNETRNGLEDSSTHDGLKFLAALNGTTAGGGYEIALACDEILLVDDRSSVVSLPETPLLGVLPGTGGLTRLVDKRRVRRDLADVFCTTADGVRADRALAWGLVDHIAAPNAFPQLVHARAEALSSNSARTGEGIALTPLRRSIDEAGYRYSQLDVAFDRDRRLVTITVRAPADPQPATIDEIVSAGADWWPLALARELDDAFLMLRTNETALGLWVLKTEGDPRKVLENDAFMIHHRDHWLVRETIGALRRTLARLEVSARSLYAIVGEGSCFAGLLFELALAADRSYMLSILDQGGSAPVIALDDFNFGLLPMVNGQSRLGARFHNDPAILKELTTLKQKGLTVADVVSRGLVTIASDELDWEDEIRLALEERASLSPDALSGLEANLRFGGPESLHSKIFARLSAWQNWIFNRPNATGEQGSLKLFGSGSKPRFDWDRV